MIIFYILNNIETKYNSNIHLTDISLELLKKFKGISLVFDWLNQFGHAKMTGSGSCIFIPLDSIDKGKEILEKRPQDTLGFVVRGIDNHPHLNLMLG